MEKNRAQKMCQMFLINVHKMLHLNTFINASHFSPEISHPIENYSKNKKVTRTLAVKPAMFQES